MAQGPWFYCLKHHTVEDRDGCAERHRLGPSRSSTVWCLRQ